MWVKFTGDFTFKPKHTVIQKFPAGAVVNATRACADAAIAAGKAELVTPTGKPKAAPKPETAA